jgi:hypothetical protein
MTPALKLGDSNRCKRPPVIDPLRVNGEPRWRVRCSVCNRMSLHFSSQSHAVTDWNEANSIIWHPPAFLGEG